MTAKTRKIAVKGSPLGMLSASEVRRSGLVGDPKKQILVWLEGAYRKVTYDPDLRSLKLDMPYLDKLIPINLFTRNLNSGYGVRIAFECNKCRKPCNYLVYDSLSFICIDDYISSPSVFSKAHRHALVREARDRLTSTKFRIRQPAVERAPSTGTTSDRSAKSNRTSTARAIALGRGAAQFEWFFAYMATPAVDWMFREQDRSFGQPNSLDDLGAYASLDIRALTKAGAFREGTVWSKLMGWPTELTGGKPMLLIVDNRDSPSFLMVTLFGEGEPAWRRIDVLRNFNGRRAFYCPATYQPADILYWRDGNFASRQFQRLRHWSQSTSGRKIGRLRSEARRLQEWERGWD